VLPARTRFGKVAMPWLPRVICGWDTIRNANDRCTRANSWS
jgi:hypothetical protein